MKNERRTKRIHTVVIGGGQAGLAAGRELSRRDIPFVILDGAERVGDAWRNRWDSLRLFTPRRYSRLPGMPFPGDPRGFPPKDEVADYLEAYAQRFDLPVMPGRRVTRLARDGDGFVVETGDERILAHNVIVAMATYQKPRTPPFADELSPEIRQIHSGAYRNPAQLRDGSVLVVGAANSGTEIAMELARGRETTLAGRKVATVPFRIESAFGRYVGVSLVIGFLFHHVLTIRTPIGRRLRPKFLSEGGMVVRVKPNDLEAVGVRRAPKVAGVEDGLPKLADGRVVAPANIVWCTGFRPDFSWIDIPVFDEGAKEPRHVRGVVEEVPGLFFMGLFFLYAASSGIFRGVGRDAAYVVDRVAARAEAPVGAMGPASPVAEIVR